MSTKLKSLPVTTPEPVPFDYKPRTPLGRKLLEIRRRIIASGEPLLSLDELERELAERRGEVDEEK